MQAHQRDNTHLHVPGVAPTPFGPALELSLLVSPLVRSGVGYDFVRPRAALRRALLAAILPWIFIFLYVGVMQRRLAEGIGYDWQLGFSVVSLVAALVTFAARVREIRRSQGRHALEGGLSRLTRVAPRLPTWLTEIVLTPALIALVGEAFRLTLSYVLGWTLIASAGGYAIVAVWEVQLAWRKRVNAVSDAERARQFDDATRNVRGVRPNVHADASASVHDAAGLGAAGPTAGSWRAGSESAAPDIASWIFRRRRPDRGGRVAAPSFTPDRRHEQ